MLQHWMIWRSCSALCLAARFQNFMNDANSPALWIVNPAQFVATKQTSKMFGNNAELTTLTPSEITAIFSDAALTVCQALGMTDHPRLCLVYEEAHSLVPEWNSVAA